MIEREDKFAVLFVDDEEKALKYFTKAFEREFPILVANSVAAAKAILAEQSERIGVLVTDQRMPEAKGVDLLRHVRAEYPQITRMLTTAYSDLDDAIDAVNRGEIIRYISKPWDVKTLRIELQQAMQIFHLRRERDELMQEKLSAWQRMQGVNRVRDLLAMASGVTATRNAVPAMQAFIEQAPAPAITPSDAAKLDVWRNLQEDILAMLALGQETAAKLRQSSEADGDGRAAQLGPALDEAEQRTGAQLARDIPGGLPQLPLAPHRAVTLFASLIGWADARAPGKPLRIAAEADSVSLAITIAAPEASWGDTSLLNVEAKLLAAYLICYDLGGRLAINPQSGLGLSIAISLPIAKADQSEPLQGPGLAWLEDALLRFENWSRPPY